MRVCIHFVKVSFLLIFIIFLSTDASSSEMFPIFKVLSPPEIERVETPDIGPFLRLLKAKELFRKGQYKRVVEILDPLVDDLRDPRSLYYLGVSWFRLGNLKRAIRILRKVREMRPDDERVLLFLGMAYLKQELYEEAADCLAKVCEKTGDPSHYLLYIVTLVYIEDWEQAEKALQVFAKKVKPVDYPLYFYCWAVVWAARGYPDRSRAALEKFLNLASEQEKKVFSARDWIKLERISKGS